MTQYSTAYGTTTYSTQPVWVLNCDDLYYYGEPIPLQRGHLQTGYYSQHFDTQQQALDYIAANGLMFLDEPPPYRPEDGQLDWFAGEVIGMGFLRRFNEIRYKAIQPHTTQTDWTPDVTPALWEVVPDGNEWQPWVWYAFDCIYNELEYRIIIPHTSQPGWEPPNVPNLWKLKETVIPEDNPEWQQPQPGVDEPFMAGDTVSFGGFIWVCDVDNNWWQPGLFGWTIVQDAEDPEPPEPDLCLTSPIWDGNNWATYTVGYHVKYNGSIWKAKNTSHTWIAPAHDGNGSISWEFVKDC